MLTHGDLLVQVCEAVCVICKASIYQDLSPRSLFMNVWHKSLEVFLSLFFRGSCSESKLLCFHGGTKARPWGNRSCVKDFISHTSVWKGGMQTLLPSAVDAISSVTTDSTLWENKVVFNETDMLQNEHNKVKMVNHHFTRLSGKISLVFLLYFNTKEYQKIS